MRQEEKALIMGAEGSQLRLQMLAPAFQPRKPTSPKVDNPRETIRTQTVQQAGSAVRFVALLQPNLAAGAAVDFRPEVIEKSDAPIHLILHGAGWTDHLYHSDHAVIISQPEGVQITSQSSAIRVRGKTVDSCVALQVTSLAVDGISLHPPSPLNLGLQRLDEGGWILDSSAKLQGVVTLPKSFTLIPLSEPDPSAKSGQSFRYRVAKEG